MEKLKSKALPALIALSALSVSASAAFYSISGLSKLFAGASMEVIVMASSLEVAKLVIASLLYQYWDSLNKGLRAYLSVATIVLILITSMGIYGFLSAAYQDTANKVGGTQAQVDLLDTKLKAYQEQLQGLSQEKAALTSNISDLRSGLAGNTQTYKDKKGNVLSTSSQGNRKAFERQLDQAVSRQEQVNQRIDELNNKIFETQTEIVEVSSANEAVSELGPLKFISGLTGVSMDRIVNVLLLIIIFVFDPLAIALVIAANFAFSQLRPKKEYPIEEKVEDMRRVVDAYDSLDLQIKDWDGALDWDDDLEWEDWEEQIPWEDIAQDEASYTQDDYVEPEPAPQQPGLYFEGRRILKTPDRTGQVWTVVFEDRPNVRVKVPKAAIVRVE